MESSVQLLASVNKWKYFDVEVLDIMNPTRIDDNESTIDLNEVSSDDWTVLNDIQHYLHDAEYSLSSHKGAKLWNVCKVGSFIKLHKFTVFQMVSDFKIFSKSDSYAEYEQIYGFGSFLEEICRLAYDSPQACLYFCKTAFNQFWFRQKFKGKDFLNMSPLEFAETEWKKLKEFDETSVRFDTSFDKYDQYCLGPGWGAEIWNSARVKSFLEKHPKIIFDIVSDCNKFSNFCCYWEYLDEYSTESLYEEVFELSYDSPYFCLKISQTSYEYFSVQIIKQCLLQIGIDSDAVSIIAKYVYSNKYIDAFLNIEAENDVFISESKKSLSCKYCGDFVKQYELGLGAMDSFCVSNDDGYTFWRRAKVKGFVSGFPEIAFRVASHCKVFDKYLDYKHFEEEYETVGLYNTNTYELYSQLFMLAYESPYICLKLCEASIWNYCFDEWKRKNSYNEWIRKNSMRIISISLYEARQIRQSLQENGFADCLIEIIGSYLFEYRQELR